MNDEFNYCYYLVAFIDLLGQKEAFRGISSIPTEDDHESGQKLRLAHEQTVLFLETFRKGFSDLFRSIVEDSEQKLLVPQDKKAKFDKMCKVILKHQRFSDSIMAFVPLRREEYHINSVNGVMGIFVATGGLLLATLAEQKVFRAGIDVGVGTELSNGEVYGPALFSAYELESKVAMYPRIVIGSKLLDYLRSLSSERVQFPGQDKDDIKLCKQVADICLRMITIDIDGQPILDYFGDELKRIYSVSFFGVAKATYADVVRNAASFAENEYLKRKKQHDEKLALRYFLLYRYLSDRLQKKIAF